MSAPRNAAVNRALIMRFARWWWRSASQYISVRFELDGRGLWLTTLVHGRRVDDVLFVPAGVGA